MAATYKDNGGSVNGSNKVFTYDFPVLQTEDIKVALNGVTQATTKYTPSLSPANITFNNTSVDSSVQESDGSPKSGVTVRVYRETTVGTNTGNEDPKVVFAAGSSIRAGDLNANIEQSLFGIQEQQEKLILAENINTGAITSDKILDGTIVNADVNASAAIAGTKVSPDFGSQAVVTTGTLAAGATTVTGNITVSGTVDGRDVATDGTKLDTVDNDANNYTHPSHPGDDFSVDTGALTGAVVVSDVDINVTTDGSGHVTDANGSVSTRTLTLANLGYTGDTDAKNDQTASEIKTLLNSDKLTNAQIDDNTVGPDQLAHTAVTAGSYGSSTSIPSLTVDAQGRVTAASGNSVNFDVVADTTPQLGGNLDVNGKDIITTSNSDIELDPDGSGKVVFKGNATKGSGQFKLNCENNSHAITIKGPPHSAAATYTLTLPNNDGDTGQYLKTDGVGNLSWDTVSGGGGGGSGTAAPNNIVTFSGNIDGNNKTYSLSVTPDSAQNLIVSLNGVVQKPNAGTSIANSEEGYCVNEGNLIFATAPASGSSMFITELSATAAGDSIVEGNSKVDVFDDNATAHVKIELDGAEKFRVYQNGEIGLGGANYGTSGQFLKSQGSGSAAVWSNVTPEGTAILSTGESGTTKFLRVDGDGTCSWQVPPDTNTQVGGSTGVDFNDSVKARFGTGNDLEIWHSGDHAFIRNDVTGGMNLQSDNSIWLSDGDGTESYIGCTQNGKVELRYDNAKKLETTSDGVQVSDLADTSVAIKLEASTGTAGYISGSSANNEIGFLDNQSHWLLYGVKDGAVELRYDNSNKLQTISTGVQINGNLNLPTGDVQLNDSQKLRLGNGQDLDIYHIADTTNVISGTGPLTIQSDDTTSGISLQTKTGGETMGEFIKNGAVKLYYDDSKKFETTETGATVTGILTSTELSTGRLVLNDDGTSSPTLHLRTDDNSPWAFNIQNSTFADSGSNSNTGLKMYQNNNGNYFIYFDGGASSKDWEIRDTASGTDNKTITYESGAVKLFKSGAEKLSTQASGVDVTGDATNMTVKFKTNEGTTRGWVWCESDEDIGFLTAAGSWKLLIDADGDYTFAGSNVSDRDRKDNITTVTGTSLDKITKLVPKTFNWKATDDGRTLTNRTFTGFIAQEVKEHLPSLVTGTDGQKNMAVEYNGILAHAVKAITELSAEVETLKTKVAALEAK